MAKAKKQDPAEILAEKAAELERVREGADMTYGGDQREDTGELTVVDNHPADVADYVHQRELHDTTQEILDREAEQVREAQARLALGQYGICAECGNKIPDARMKARPEATLCIECQTRRESQRVA
jgi:RNA polymerase-binding transcription factor DksA